MDPATDTLATAKKSAKRGRPRGFDVEAGLAAARDLFAWKGYDAVGVADLCSVLGIKPPSLYSAYGSKRALFDRVVETYLRESGVVYGEAIEAAQDLADLRKRVLGAATDLYTKDGGNGCLVIASLGATRDDDLRRDLTEIVEARREAMVARALTFGVSREEAAAEVAAISVAMMGLSAAARAGMPEAALRSALDRLA